MKTGAVILNFNSWKMTDALARKLAAFSVIDEVVIVDTGVCLSGAQEKNLSNMT